MSEVSKDVEEDFVKGDSAFSLHVRLSPQENVVSAIATATKKRKKYFME